MWFARAASADIAPSRVAGNPWTSVPFDAIHDRFPSQLRAQRYAEILQGVGDLPMGNPSPSPCCAGTSSRRSAYWRRRVCPCPPCAAIRSTSRHRLAAWGTGFIKPRYTVRWGSASRVEAGAASHGLPGVVLAAADPSILQAAIAPPRSWASRTVRVLIQRTPEGWWSGTPVVRQSREDPVANAARGAQVASGDQVLDEETLARLRIATDALCPHWTASTQAVWHSRLERFCTRYKPPALAHRAQFTASWPDEIPLRTTPSGIKPPHHNARAPRHSARCRRRDDTLIRPQTPPSGGRTAVKSFAEQQLVDGRRTSRPGSTKRTPASLCPGPHPRRETCRTSTVTGILLTEPVSSQTVTRRPTQRPTSLALHRTAAPR